MFVKKVIAILLQVCNGPCYDGRSNLLGVAKELHKLPLGYYEADVYIDGCLSYTHLFYIPEWHLVGQSAEVTYKNGHASCGNCGDVRNTDCICDTDLCGSSVPTVDEEVVEHRAVGCETGCK